MQVYTTACRPCPISTTPPPFQLIMIPMSQIKHKSRAVPAHSTLTDVTPRSSLRLAESLTLDPAHGQSMHRNSTGSRRGCQDDIGLGQPLLIRASRRAINVFLR